jgi:hypothetical protein
MIDYLRFNSQTLQKGNEPTTIIVDEQDAAVIIKWLRL